MDTDKLLKNIPQVNEKNRKYVLGGILCLVFIVYYFIIMQPQLSTLRTLNPEITLITQDLQKVKDDVQKMAQYRKQAKELENKIASLGGGIKTKDDVSKVLERISLLANKYRLRIDQMMPLPENQKVLLKNSDGKYLALPVLIDCHGGYHDFGRFLADVEQNEASLKIEKFTIAANPQDMMKHSIKLTVNAILLDVDAGGKK